MLIDMYMSDDNKPIGWWLKEVDRLTPEGAAALEQLTTKVHEQRLRVTNGIVDAEYLQTIDVLRRMAANLNHEAGTSATPGLDAGTAVTAGHQPGMAAGAGNGSAA